MKEIKDIFRLYELREYSNKSQTEIAKILHIRQQTYSTWETNNKIIPLKHLFNLAKYYNVSLDFIANLSNNKNFKITINNIDRKIVGNRLILFRKKFNIKQKELAKILNTTPSTICAYEKGKTLILTAFAMEIAQKYNISLDWLTGNSEEMLMKKKD